MKLWQQACDLAAWDVLSDSGLEMPEHVKQKYWEGRRFHDRTAEEIYDILFSQQPPPEPQDPQGDGEPDDDEEDGDGEGIGGSGVGDDEVGDGGKAGDPADNKEKQKKWDNKVIQAISMQKRMGKGSAGIERIVEHLNKQSEVDWRKELRSFVEKVTKGDYTWAQPNRRYMSSLGLYLPSLHSREIGTIAIGVDTSGSIGKDELAQFEAELNKIFSEFPTNIIVIYCDDEVCHVDRFSSSMSVKLQAYGGGGTSFEPVFEYIEEHKINPECLIYFTDCYGSYPERKPKYPTLWGSTTDMDSLYGGYKPPFGKFLRVRVGE